MGVVTTKTGDKGSTHLKDKVVSKGSLRVDAIGSIDELIATLILTQSITQLDRNYFETPIKKLIEIGSYLAGYKEAPDFKETIAFMEKIILERRETYNGFIYPYDDTKKAQINVARTIVRRAERTLIRLHEESPQPETLLIFMNRLSDYIFVFIG